MEKNEYAPPLWLDERIQTPQMKAVKAMIPYMEPSVGKMAALAVKMMEIKNIMDSFDTDIAIPSAGANRSTDMLHAIRPYCDGQTLKLTEFIEKADEMRKMAELMSELSSMDIGNE